MLGYALGMSVDPEDGFELPRKFQHGVIRRERCDSADIEPISAAGVATDVQGNTTWRGLDRIATQDGVAAVVRVFAALSAEGVDFTGYSFGRRSFYDSKLSDRRWPLMLRMLDLVRSATDEEYAEAIATAEKMRDEYPSPASRAGSTHRQPPPNDTKHPHEPARRSCMHASYPRCAPSTLGSVSRISG